jgi:peptidoglycan/xylan/chitin deacetylase (PgdA/CDA1 family)
MNVPCPTHGSQRAHRGCHFCRRPICRLCEVKMHGHFYCSTRCAREAGHAAWRRWFWERLARPVPSTASVFLVLLAAGAPTLTALRAVSELDRLSTPTAFAVHSRAPGARIESVTSGPAGSRIEGRAAPGAAVFLFAGGQFAGATFSEQGQFRFDGVRAAGPYRVGALFLSSENPLASPAPAPPPTAKMEARPPEARPLEIRGSEPSALVPDFTRGPEDRREIVVSFDAGSSDRGAQEILNALKDRGIRTTVFLTGDFIRHYPDLARRVAADGHEVGNHTDTHPHLTTFAQDGRQATRPGVDRAFLTGELERTARLFREATGREMAPLWRAPYGEQNGQIRRWAAEAGYWHVGWTGGRAGLDGLDWISDPDSPAYRTSRRVVERLVAHAENGGVILLHLGSDRSDPVAPRIPELLDGLAGRGFRLVKASDFLDRQGMTPARLAALTVPRR